MGLLKFLKELARLSISTTFFFPFFGRLVIQESLVFILFWGDRELIMSDVMKGDFWAVYCNDIQVDLDLNSHTDL